MAAPWLPSSQSGRLPFFDLAAETRNQIYHHLFDGKLIHIREKDDDDEIEEQPEVWANAPDKPPPAQWLIIRRNQAMGLNLLLASRQCLAEAKPVLLGSATFDIKVDFWSDSKLHCWSEGSTIQGFSIHDLRQTRFVRYDTSAHHIDVVAYAAPSICHSSLATMAGLRKVEIFSSSALVLACHQDDHSTLDLSLKNDVVLELVHRAFRDPVTRYRAAFYHMQKLSKEDQAEVILKQCLYLKGNRTYVCIELLSRTFWLEGTETVKGATTSEPDGITPGRRIRTPRQKGPSPQRLLELEKSEGLFERQPSIWPVKRPLREK